jgi:hypothetical protein
LPISFSLAYEHPSPSNTPCKLVRPSWVLHCRVWFDQRSSPEVNKANVGKTTSGLYPALTSLGQHPCRPAPGHKRAPGGSRPDPIIVPVRIFEGTCNLVSLRSTWCQTPRSLRGFRPLRQSFVVFASRSRNGAASTPQIHATRH